MAEKDDNSSDDEDEKKEENPFEGENLSSQRSRDMNTLLGRRQRSQSSPVSSAEQVRLYDFY